METPIQPLPQAILGLSLLLAAAAHAAVLDCEFGGQHVNPSNGSTTAGKTGLMKCVDRETRAFVREEEYREGRAIGYRKSVDFSGNTHVGTYNAQGNRDGEFKQYDPAGRERDGSQVLVKAEEFWDNGKVRTRTVRDERRNAVGVQQAFNESGVLESESTYENGTLQRRKNYKDGRLVLDEEYFEDGSRKAARKSE